MTETMLAEGDRLPDFLQRGSDGRPFSFYERYCGRPAVLLVGPAAPAAASAIRAAVADDIPVSVLTVGDRAATSGDGIDRLGDDGRLTAAIVGKTGESRALILDATTRIAAVTALDDGEPNGVRERVAALPPMPEPATVSRLAPLLVVPDVFEPELCRALIALFEDGSSVASGMPRLVDGKVQLVPDPTAKNRRDLSVADKAMTDRLSQRLARRVLPEIRKSFYFPVTRFEALKLVRYDATDGGYFRPHRDNTTPDAAHRRFALTVNLNTGAYRGGALRFPEYGPDLYAPPPGGAVVFSCAHLHEVTDVTEGSRYALLTFFYGDEQARARAAQTATP